MEIVVKKGFFGTKYLYLDKKTRLRYGFDLLRLGFIYTLQRKKIFWKEVAFTYPIFQTKENIVKYLKWCENENKRKCAI